MNVADILRELVAIPTPSSVSNVRLLEWVRTFLEAKGWTAQLLPYSDEHGVAKANLTARPRSGDAPIDLAFVCHTDTVPYAASWAEALRLQERDGNLHGCGSCDVKGALACFLAAVGEVEAAQVDAHVALLLTADEEIGCRGMERLLAGRELRIGCAIVSEPTSLRRGIAGKGYGLARVTVRGVEAHSAYPAEGVSAIAMAARMILDIEKLGRQGPRDEEQLFDPPYTTVNVGVIEGGTAKNIVAGTCSFLVEWRPLPADAPQRMQGELEGLAERVRAEFRGADVRVEPLRAEAGFAPAKVGPLQRKLAELDAAQGRTSASDVGISFGSEASRLARVADEVIVMGPGDMHTAHSERECVPVAELHAWTATLRALMIRAGQD